MYSRRAIIVIPSSAKNYANETALLFDPEGGDKTFTVGLSSAPGGPITHYWCSAAMREDTYAAVAQMIDTDPELAGVRLFDGNTYAPDDALIETGLYRHETDEL